MRGRLWMIWIGLTVGLSCSVANPAIGAVCGTTIMQSIVVQADETCASGNGITVGADGVTIDLGGHTLRGSGSSTPVGIDTGAFSGVTIKNGVVGVFGLGIVSTPPGAHLRLSGVTSIDNAGDGAHIGAIDISIDRCAFLNNPGIGLRLTPQSGKVTNSVAAGNGGIGLAIIAGTLTISKFTSADNGRGADIVFPAVARIQGGDSCTTSTGVSSWSRPARSPPARSSATVWTVSWSRTTVAVRSPAISSPAMRRAAST